MSELKSLSALIAEIAKIKNREPKPDVETRLQRVETVLSKLTVVACEGKSDVAPDTPTEK